MAEILPTLFARPAYPLISHSLQNFCSSYALRLRGNRVRVGGPHSILKAFKVETELHLAINLIEA